MRSRLRTVLARLGDETMSQETRSGAGKRKLGLASLVDFWMPAGPDAPDQVQQSRLVIRVTLMTLGVCLLMDLKYVGEGARSLAIMTTASVLLQIVALVLHKSTGSHRLGAHCFCLALWALFFGIATLSGGIDSPNLVANAFLVVVSPMLLGRREGLLWLAAALVTAVAQLVMTQKGLVGQTLPQADLQATRLSEYFATFTTVALTAFFYRRGQDQMQAELAREKHLIDVANQDLRVILDNSDQGFLSLDRAGCITGESSAIIGTWFRAPVNGQSFASFLHAVDPETAIWFEMGWHQVDEAMMPLELSLEQLPKRMLVNGKTFGIEYRTVDRTGESFEKLVIIFSDLTAEMASERARSRQRDILEGFERILHDPEGFQSFLETARRDVDLIARGALPLDELRRRLHTLKGNAAVMGLSAVAQQCHSLEDELSDRTCLKPESVAELERELTLVEERLGPLLRERTLGEIVLYSSEYQAFLAQIVAERPHAELAAEVRSWSLGRVHSHLQRLAEYGRQLAGRLEKGPLNVETIDNGLRAHAELAEFWSVLVHVIRNAVDHGIEPMEVRRQLGKGEGRIQLRALIGDGRLVIEVADDGRGIDWQRVRERALALGMKAESRQELIAALFADGFSTKSEVSDISGRGVGLSSVLHVCASSRIEIQADSQANVGTTFRFIFPDAALAPRALQSTQQVRQRASA
jgi:signal transduction histidine kinase